MATNMNWFEGGRRITRLIQVLVGVGAAIYALLSTPYVSLTFEKNGPDSPWLVAVENCSYGSDGEKRLENGIGVGESSSTLCFRAADFDGQTLVPYLMGQKNTWYGTAATSPLGEDYINRRADAFVPSQKLRDEARNYVNREWWKQKLKNVTDGLVYGVGWILLVAGLSWVIGWIIRGFFGVPSGKDHRSADKV
jgi:hypothetical protein